MTSSRPRSHLLRGLVHTAAIAPVAALSLACLVGGERSTTGECPEGEVCSAATPGGINFVSMPTYDFLQPGFDSSRDGDLVLDAIVVGGRAEIGFFGVTDAEGRPLAHTARVSDGSVLGLRDGDGVFGGGIEVDGYVEVTGVTEGTTLLRVIASASGELFDRLSLRVVELDGARVAPSEALAPLLAGCRSELGVALFGDGIRATDEDTTIEVEGATELRRLAWDRYSLVPDADARELTVTIHAGGTTLERTVAVLTLAEASRTACPTR